MSTMLLIVNGLPRSGKDTVANFIVNAAVDAGAYARVHSSVQHVYDVFTFLKIPIDPASNKTPEQRRALAGIKRVLDEYCNLSEDVLYQEVHRMSDWSKCLGKPTILVTFIREPHSIDRLRDRLVDAGLSVMALLVAGRGDESGVTQSDSPMSILGYAGYDLMIGNGGTLDSLQAQVKAMTIRLVEELKG